MGFDNNICKIGTNKLEYYQNSPENQYLDRKSARKKPSDLLRHLVAFANAEGGQLVIGIEDDNTITGFKNGNVYSAEEFRKINSIMKDSPLDLSFAEIPVVNCEGEDDIILVISIGVSTNRVITMPNSNDVYLRQGDSSVKLSYEQRLSLEYDKGQRRFEDEVITDATLEDIDYELVENFKKLFDTSNCSVEEILKARRLIINSKITNAAILLFGKHPSQFFPQYRVRFIRFNGTSMEYGENLNIIKDVSFEDALPVLIVKVRDYIKTQLRDFQYLQRDGKFKVFPEYPEFAWFEGIVNAVTHRDYSIYGEHIKIMMFDDRLEIHSPGKLPNIVTIENIKYERFARNPRIARVLTEFGWVRELNEGVKRIYSEMEKAFLNEPIYSEPGNKVVLTLENNMFSRHLRAQESLENEFIGFNSLSADEQIIIYYMYNSGEKMTTSKAMEITGRSRNFIIETLHKLCGIGIIKWRGTSSNDPKQHYILVDSKESKGE